MVVVVVAVAVVVVVAVAVVAVKGFMNFRKFSDAEERLTNRLFPRWAQWAIGLAALGGALWFSWRLLA